MRDFCDPFDKYRLDRSLIQWNKVNKTTNPAIATANVQAVFWLWYWAKACLIWDAFLAATTAAVAAELEEALLNISGTRKNGVLDVSGDEEWKYVLLCRVKNQDSRED